MQASRFVVAILSCFISVSATSAERESALRKIPDNVVAYLKGALASSGEPLTDSLNNSIQMLIQRLEAMESSGDWSRLSDMQRNLLPALRAELRGARDEIRRRYSEQARQQNSNNNQADDALLSSSRIRVRFLRVDNALEKLALAREGAEARGAARGLQQLLNGYLRAQTELTTSVPPTMKYHLKEVEAKPDLRDVAVIPPAYARFEQDALAKADHDNRPRLFLTSAAPVVSAEAGADCSIQAADLAADNLGNVVLNDEIRALAQSLDYSPAKILQWMHKEVKFEPYWGAMKGAMGVLNTRAGNATDTSSLLISLLRASGVPARYVYGKVALYDFEAKSDGQGRVQKWLGVKNYSAARAVLGRLTPTQYPNNDNPTGLEFSHVWVQACVPFASYRGGAVEASGNRWLPLDGVIKDHDVRAGTSVSGANSTLYGAYMDRRSDELPLQYLEREALQRARTQNPSATIADIPYQGIPRTFRQDVLPSTPPFLVTEFLYWPGLSTVETAVLPLAHHNKFSLRVTRPGGTPSTLAQATLIYPRDVYKRLSVSYRPTAATQGAWNAWQGNVGTPNASIQVYPVIQLDGQDIATGIAAPAMPLGTIHSIYMEAHIDSFGGYCNQSQFSGYCINNATYNKIKAGAYYAPGVDALHTSAASLDKEIQGLNEGVAANSSSPTPANPGAYDATVGRLLHVVFQSFLHEGRAAEVRLGELYGFKAVPGYDIGLAGSDLTTSYVLDQPYVVKPSGVYVDVKGGLADHFKIDSAAPFSRNPGETEGQLRERRKSTLRQEIVDIAPASIYSLSAIEHNVWQQALRLDAVSTVRGLQYAKEVGIPVYTFGTTTGTHSINQFPSLMDVGTGPTSMSSVRPAIETAVNAGGSVTVPRIKIAYPDPVDPSKAWRGAIYMTVNPTTAEYSAAIDGQLSGGYPLINSSTFSQLYAPVFDAPSFMSSSFSAVNPSPLMTLNSGRQGYNAFASFSGDPVNMLTGNYVHSEQDFAIKARGGFPVILERWYNSGSPQDGPFGFGWTHSFNHKLKLHGVESGKVRIGWVNGSGGESFFSAGAHSNGDVTRGSVIPNPPGMDVLFTRISGGADDGKFSIRERNGLVYLFESKVAPNVTPGPATAVFAKLLSITDRNGNRHALNYQGELLASITDGMSRTVLQFVYVNNRITEVFDYTGRKYRYEYTDGNGNLNRAINPLGQAREYTYYTAADGQKLDHHLRRHKKPRGNGVEFVYYNNGQVFQHTNFDEAGQLIASSTMSFHYNLFTRESWSINERGIENRFWFDEHGNTIQEEDGGGAIKSYEYSDSARPNLRTKAMEANGNWVEYYYDEQNLLYKERRYAGEEEWADKVFYGYNAFGMPQVIHDGARNLTVWQRFDAKGNLTDVIHSQASELAGVLPAVGNMLAWQRHEYDAYGNPVKSTRVKDFAAQSGPSVIQNYDSNRLNVVSLTRTGQRNESTVTENSPAFTYDALNRPKTSVDGRWYPTTTVYDDLDRVLTSIDSTGKQQHVEYDVNGNVKSSFMIVKGTRVDSSAVTYDARDRAVRSMDNAGNVNSFEYDEVGNRIAQTSADNYTLRFDYDAANRPYSAYDAEGNRVLTMLDSVGRPRSVIDPNGHVTKYDYFGNGAHDGRLKETQFPAIPGQAAGRKQTLEYSLAGHVVKQGSVNADGVALYSHSHYDKLGRVVREVSDADDAGNRLQKCYRYDNLSNLTEIWAGPTHEAGSPECWFPNQYLKRQATYAWDDFGQRISLTDQLGRTWKTRYDFNGNVSWTQTPEQARVSAATGTEYVYDAEHAGALKTRNVPGAGNKGQVIAYTRDALGRVKTAETRDGSGSQLVAYSYAYDTAHRLTGVLDSRSGQQIIYGYTPGGRLASMVFGVAPYAGYRWDYKYDAVGRFSGIVAPNGQSVVFAMDAGGRITERKWQGGMASRYDWHPDGSLAAVEHTVGTTQMAKHAYTYNSWGLRETATDILTGQSRVHTYGYDPLQRLKSVDNGNAAEREEYQFDLFGNRLVKTIGGTSGQRWNYQHDSAHQLLEVQRTIAGVTTTNTLARYDDNGNLVKLCEAGTTGTVSGSPTDCTASGGDARASSLTWNGEDQLVALARNGNAALAEAYAYDDGGRRISKTSAGATSHYAYNGQDILAEWAGAMTASPGAIYSHGGGIDQPLARFTGAIGTTGATVRYYTQDGLGSVSALVTAEGTPGAQTQRFDAWGALTQGGGVPQYGYTGREPDASGLTYYRARYYSAALGRFFGRDPLGMQDAINQYAYVRNDPINAKDPMGMDAMTIGGTLNILGAGGSLGVFVSFPGPKTKDNFDIGGYFSVAAPGWPWSSVIKDTVNPDYPDMPGGLNLARATIDVGYSWDGRSAIDGVNVGLGAGLGFWGGTVDMQSPSVDAIPVSGFQINVGPQVRYAAQINQTGTASIGDAFREIIFPAAGAISNLFNSAPTSSPFNGSGPLSNFKNDSKIGAQSNAYSK